MKHHIRADFHLVARTDTLYESVPVDLVGTVSCLTNMINRITRDNAVYLKCFRIEVDNGDGTSRPVIDGLQTLHDAKQTLEYLATFPQASSADAMDYMAIWEWYLGGDSTARLDLIDTGEGAVSKREWVADTLTPILNDAYKQAHEHGFDDSYDWEFVPRFLTAMHSMVPFDKIDDYNFTHLALRIGEGQII